MDRLQFSPADSETGERLDKVITDRLAGPRGPSLSRVRVQQLIKEGFVTVNGRAGKPAYRLEGGEQVIVELAPSIVAPPDANANVQPEALPLDVIYDDPVMAAINKPAGMVVHPAVGHLTGTLVNAILARWPQVAQVGGEERAGIVHRLDKDTSGVILIAKTEAARLALMAQFAARTVQKRYLALVEGVPETQSGQIEAPIGRDPDRRKQMAIMPTNRGGREAVSQYRVVHQYDGFALLEVFPKTGRTHQIRVHMAFIGHPIVGDAVYGPRKPRMKLGRHFLHAESISLRAPLDDRPLSLHAPLPAELQAVLDRLAPQS
jgi:23S rRNA pseudouridine1911/1915/1917 synthase